MSIRCAVGDDIGYTSDQAGHTDARLTLEVYAKSTKRRERLIGAHLREFDKALDWARMGTAGQPGACAITLPHHKGGDYSPGFWVMVTMRPLMDFHATVHSECGSYWAEVAELPGCFASGDTEAELQEALIEAIRMCAGDEFPVDELRLTALTLAAS